MASEVVAEEKMEVEDSSSVVPEFPALSAKQINAGAVEMRSVKCPPAVHATQRSMAEHHDTACKIHETPGSI